MDLKSIVEPESTPAQDDHTLSPEVSYLRRRVPDHAVRIAYSSTASSPDAGAGCSSASALPSPTLSPQLEEFSAYTTTKPAGLDRRSLSAPDISTRPHDGRIDTHAARSGSTPSSSTKSPGSNRRYAHILSEQRRRENINGGFLELKGNIPQCRGTQDSKAVILHKAVVYISSLESELARVKNELYACQQQRTQRQQQPMVPQQQPTPVHSHRELPAAPPPPAPAMMPSLPPPPPHQIYVHPSPPVSSLPPPPPPPPPLSHPVALPLMSAGQYYPSYAGPHHIQHAYAMPMPPRMTAEWKVPGTV
ncbi:hypothetical protein V1517DRAFT_311707 [Lipomyces orientalis]|uniref:Uncharacterized protein n=1 Tax=Lipomyces orientalis TaxID=1233043 RepID=A0ACC3TYX6_9ASCO